MKKILMFLIAILVIVAGVFVFFRDKDVVSVAEEREKVEAYIRANISNLSPEEAVLGGTFYVTEVMFEDAGEDGKGIVSYEDGHIALVAEFTYKLDGEVVTIDSFEIVPDSQLENYSNSDLGIQFDYPSHYVLSEQNKSVVLTEEVVVPENSEGPPSISISAFTKPTGQSLREWVISSQFSNYQIDGRDLRQVTVAGRDSLRYSHSGLYEADAVAVLLSNDTVLMIFVTYLSSEDSIRQDFETVINSFEFI